MAMVTMFGWISNRAAISESVASSFSAAKATFDLNSAEYRFRFRLLLSSSFRQSNLRLIRLSEKKRTTSYFGVTNRTVLNWIHTGRLDAVHISGHVRIPEDAL